jgi:hypothetical protein
VKGFAIIKVITGSHGVILPSDNDNPGPFNTVKPPKGTVITGGNPLPGLQVLHEFPGEVVKVDGFVELHFIPPSNKRMI